MKCFFFVTLLIVDNDFVYLLVQHRLLYQVVVLMYQYPYYLALQDLLHRDYLYEKKRMIELDNRTNSIYQLIHQMDEENHQVQILLRINVFDKHLQQHL